MEFLFYRGGSEGNVSWLAWSEENTARTESDFRQSKSAPLQWSRNNRNRCEAFSGAALRRRFGTLAPCSTKLLPRSRRGPPIVAAGCSRGQRLNHPVWQIRYFFSAAKCRAGCGSVRGSPLLSSHFSRGLAPQVGQRTAKACSFSAFMTT